jgi:hypothetical protein
MKHVHKNKKEYEKKKRTDADTDMNVNTEYRNDKMIPCELYDRLIIQ